MRRKTARNAWLSTVGLGVGIWGSNAGRSAEPGPLAPQPPAGLMQIQDKKDPPPKVDPKTPEPPPTQPVAPADPFSQLPIAPSIKPSEGTATPPSLGSDSGSRLPGGGSPTDTTSSIAVAANSAPQVLNASDLSQLLFKSSASTGVQFQQRNPLVSDPRIRKGCVARWS